MNMFNIKNILLLCVFICIHTSVQASRAASSGSTICKQFLMSPVATIRKILSAKQKELAEKNNGEHALSPSVLGLISHDGHIEQISHDAQDEMFQQKIDPFLQRIINLLKDKCNSSQVTNEVKNELLQCGVGCIQAYVACGYDYKRFQEDVRQSFILQLQQAMYACPSHERVVSHTDILHDMYKVVYCQKTISFDQMVRDMFYSVRLSDDVQHFIQHEAENRADEIERLLESKKAEIVAIKASLRKGKKKSVTEKKEHALTQQKEQERLAQEAAHKEKKEIEQRAKEAAIKEQQHRAQINKEAKEQAQAEAAAHKKEKNRLKNEHGVMRAKRLSALGKLQHHGQAHNHTALIQGLDKWKAFVIDAQKNEQRKQQEKEHALRASMFDVVSLKSLLNCSQSSIQLVRTTYSKKLKKETKEQSLRAIILSNIIVACHTGFYPISRDVDALDVVDMCDNRYLKMDSTCLYDSIDKQSYRAITRNVDSRLWLQEHVRGQIESHKNVHASVPEELHLRKGANNALPFSQVCYTCKKLGLIVVDGITQHE